MAIAEQGHIQIIKKCNFNYTIPGLQVNITDNGDGSLTVYSNGIPSHDTWEFPTTNNPNDLKVI